MRFGIKPKNFSNKISTQNFPKNQLYITIKKKKKSLNITGEICKYNIICGTVLRIIVHNLIEKKCSP